MNRLFVMKLGWMNCRYGRLWVMVVLLQLMFIGILAPTSSASSPPGTARHAPGSVDSHQVAPHSGETSASTEEDEDPKMLKLREDLDAIQTGTAKSRYIKVPLDYVFYCYGEVPGGFKKKIPIKIPLFLVASSKKLLVPERNLIFITCLMVRAKKTSLVFGRCRLNPKPSWSNVSDKFQDDSKDELKVEFNETKNHPLNELKVTTLMNLPQIESPWRTGGKAIFQIVAQPPFDIDYSGSYPQLFLKSTSLPQKALGWLRRKVRKKPHSRIPEKAVIDTETSQAASVSKSIEEPIPEKAVIETETSQAASISKSIEEPIPEKAVIETETSQAASVSKSIEEPIPEKAVIETETSQAASVSKSIEEPIPEKAYRDPICTIRNDRNPEVTADKQFRMRRNAMILFDFSKNRKKVPVKVSKLTRVFSRLSVDGMSPARSSAFAN